MNKISIILLLAFSPISFAIDTGASMPACTLTDISKNSDVSMPTSGKVVYVDFWASWCAPCAKSMPFLEELHQKFKTKGLDVIAINVDDDKADGIKFLEKMNVTFPIATNPDSTCAGLFSVQTMPSSYLFDKKGKLRYIELGFFSENRNDVTQKVEKLLAE